MAFQDSLGYILNVYTPGRPVPIKNIKSFEDREKTSITIHHLTIFLLVVALAKTTTVSFLLA